jgi:excisionase family DNA binding protein
MTTQDKTQSRRKRLFTLDEAGEYLGRSKWAVRHLIWNGVLPSVRIDRRVQVDVSDLEALIEKNKGFER